MKNLHFSIIIGSIMIPLLVFGIYVISNPLIPEPNQHNNNYMESLQGPSQTLTNKSTVDLMDFSTNVPFQINASRGETITVPVDIYGSTMPRSIDVVISQADPRRGVIDPSNSSLPEGFSINIPVKHIEMQPMDEKTHEKPLMTTNMTISIDNAVKPATYGFAINMLSHSPQGIQDEHERA